MVLSHMQGNFTTLKREPGQDISNHFIDEYLEVKILSDLSKVKPNHLFCQVPRSLPTFSALENIGTYWPNST